jgi:Xaa-Pro aminopeptidase
MTREHRPASLVLAIALAAGVAACGGGSPAAPSATAPSNPYSEASFREAARITAAAATEVWRAARAGWSERDVKALIDTAFAQQGSGVPAFAHIVAAGAHGIELHYAGDTGVLADGELLLIDLGATSNQHCADVSRTYPVSGRFTPRQAELYRLVLDAQAVAAAARVGVDSLVSTDAAVRAFFRASRLRAADASGVDRTLDQYFVHSIGHAVGREVHGADTGFSARAPLQAGQVIALEPGLYIPSEGLAIRIEDTYLVTAQGLSCLSCAAPKDVVAVER